MLTRGVAGCLFANQQQGHQGCLGVEQSAAATVGGGKRQTWNVCCNSSGVVAQPHRHHCQLLLPQDDLCSFFNALMTCSGAQLDSGNSVISCSITRDKGPPYAFIKLRSVQEASNALAFSGIQFRGHTLKVRHGQWWRKA